jgi:hypothetical protein
MSENTGSSTTPKKEYKMWKKNQVFSVITLLWYYCCCYCYSKTVIGNKVSDYDLFKFFYSLLP